MAAQCERCGSFATSGVYCENCGAPLAPAQPTSLDGWDFCEIKAQGLWHFQKRFLIPVAAYFQDWCFVALGRRLGRIFVAAESPNFSFKNWDGKFEKFLNAGGADKLHSTGASDSLHNLKRELYKRGWVEVTHGPGWFQSTFRRRTEPLLTLGEVVDKFLASVGFRSEDVGVPSELVDMFGHDAGANARHATGYSPLHIVACWGRIELAALLLDNGAQPGSANTDGKTPIDLAKAADEKPMAEFLVGALEFERQGYISTPESDYSFENIARVSNDETLKRILRPFMQEKYHNL